MTTTIQRSLSGGEVSPAFHARADLNRYQSSLKTLRNFIVRAEGGVTTRPGTRFSGPTKSPMARLFPIKSPGPDAITQGNIEILEVGNEYIRIHTATWDDPLEFVMGAGVPRDLTVRPRLMAPMAITSIEKPTGDVLEFTCTGHGLTDGDWVSITVRGLHSVAPIPHQFPNPAMVRNYFVVDKQTDDTFRLLSVGGTTSYLQAPGIDPTGMTGFFQKVFEVSTPYSISAAQELQIDQSGTDPNFIVSAHPIDLPAKILLADTFSLSPETPAPTSLAASGSGGSGNAGTWVVTAVRKDTEEESLQSSSATSTNANTTLTWNNSTIDEGLGPTTGHIEDYNIYKLVNGTYQLVDIVKETAGATTSWTIEGAMTTRSKMPPVYVDPYPSAHSRPAVVKFIRQRLALASPALKRNEIRFSRVMQFHNFTSGKPIADNDAITALIADSDGDTILNIADPGRPILFCRNGEFMMGDELTPGSISIKKQSSYGSERPRPVVVGKEAIFVQRGYGAIRSIGYRYEVDGAAGGDLSVLAKHLLTGHWIRSDLAYAVGPTPIVWAVRGDGVLLGLTYMPDHEIAGWHRHDTDGQFIHAATGSLAGHNLSFFSVLREIDGKSVGSVEYMDHDEDRLDTPSGKIRMDSTAVYDGKALIRAENGWSFGRDTPITATLSGGTTWDENDVVTLGTSENVFMPYGGSNPVEKIHLWAPDGKLVRLTVLLQDSANVLTCKPIDTVPESLRDVATPEWAIAAKGLSGLGHLEGKKVAVVADGSVVANPNNPSLPEITVTDGKIELDDHYSVIQVGLPYVADIETLELESPEGTLVDRKKIVQKVTLRVETSRGIWVGPNLPNIYAWVPMPGIFMGKAFPGADAISPVQGMTEKKGREIGEEYGPPKLKSGVIDLVIPGQWGQGGHVAIRQIDPVPLTILSIAPTLAVAGGR